MTAKQYKSWVCERYSSETSIFRWRMERGNEDDARALAGPAVTFQSPADAVQSFAHVSQTVAAARALRRRAGVKTAAVVRDDDFEFALKHGQLHLHAIGFRVFKHVI